MVGHDARRIKTNIVHFFYSALGGEMDDSDHDAPSLSRLFQPDDDAAAPLPSLPFDVVFMIASMTFAAIDPPPHHRSIQRWARTCRAMSAALAKHMAVTVERMTRFDRDRADACSHIPAAPTASFRWRQAVACALDRDVAIDALVEWLTPDASDFARRRQPHSTTTGGYVKTVYVATAAVQVGDAAYARYQVVALSKRSYPCVVRMTQRHRGESSNVVTRHRDIDVYKQELRASLERAIGNHRVARNALNKSFKTSMYDGVAWFDVVARTMRRHLLRASLTRPAVYDALESQWMSILSASHKHVAV